MTATTADFDSIVRGLREMGVPLDRAQDAARRELGISGNGVDVPEIDEGALEDDHVAAADEFMRALGFEVVSFSQKKRAKVTPGIPDRRYYRRPRTPQSGGPWTRTNMRCEAVVLWWEAKSATGRQRPDQKLFQEMAEACGETYVLGTHEDLINWLAVNRIAVRVGGVLEPVACEVAR